MIGPMDPYTPLDLQDKITKKMIKRSNTQRPKKSSIPTIKKEIRDASESVCEMGRDEKCKSSSSRVERQTEAIITQDARQIHAKDERDSDPEDNITEGDDDDDTDSVEGDKRAIEDYVLGTIKKIIETDEGRDKDKILSCIGPTVGILKK